jgi:AbiV family abortive infection protein
MERQDAKPDVSPNVERLRGYSRGAQLIFENAEALYNEAQALGQSGSLARAAALHQISMEECAKIDMLGACATSILMGHEVDDDHMAKVFRDHKVKNHTNAYNATTSPEEQEARARGDWKAASAAFKKFQGDFHIEVNTIKNAALYVDFREGQFVSPKDAIPEPIAAALMELNAEFLRRSALFIRLLKRIEAEPWKFAASSRHFLERAEALRREGNLDPETMTKQLLEEMGANYK